MRAKGRLIAIAAVVAIVLCAGACGIVLRWEKSSSCSAAPPQAGRVGYTHPVFCDAFNDNRKIDVDNTLNPQFLLHPSAQGFTTAASSISNHGTGLQLNAGILTSVVKHSPMVRGHMLVGGFYAEVDMKFDSSVCINDSHLWPAFWFNYAPALFFPPLPPVRYTELDAFEWLDCRALGTVHDWPAGGGPHNCQNSNNDVSSSFSPGNGWNTYGTLLVPSTSDRGGKGMIRWYYNNRLMATVTYSRTGFPEPASGCPRGAFATADTQPWAFTLYGGTKDSTVFRNLHIYQAPAPSLFRRILDWLH